LAGDGQQHCRSFFCRPAAFRDVDTPADWEILRQRVKPRLEEAAKVKK